MAEIRVERKKRSMLPLLLGLLALLALLWWFLNRGDNTTIAGTDTTSVATGVVEPAPGVAATAGTGATTATANDTSAAGTLTAAGTTGAAAGTATGTAALNDYATFVASSGVERTEEQQYEYTAGGIRRLAAAIESMNPAGAARAQVDLMRQKADSLQIGSTGADRRADMTRAAFPAAAEAMAGLPTANRSAAQLQSVRQAAAAISPQRQLLEQRDQVQAFFDAARTALQTMGTGA